MKRTTIFADETLLQTLQEIARKENRSLSATIRSALEDFAGRRQSTRRLPSFVGIGRSGRKDIAERSDELLWQPFRNRRRR